MFPHSFMFSAQLAESFYSIRIYFLLCTSFGCETAIRNVSTIILHDSCSVYTVTLRLHTRVLKDKQNCASNYFQFL